MSAMEDILIVPGPDVAAILDGEEAEVMAIVAAAYAAHERGESVVPHSCFLPLPGDRNRAIALPAYLGGERAVAGVKWIASFPENVARGSARASGLVVLSSLATGRPYAVIEGAIVSARRTAASAAIAARALAAAPPPRIGLLGCGAINFEVLRFLLVVWPHVERVLLADLSPARAAAFAERARARFPGVAFATAANWRALAAGCALVSIATTATTPYMDALPGGELRTVLHLSLRDLAPEAVLAADNVVDDADHVCRAQTSLHLAERRGGGRRFIRCTLAEVLAGAAAPKRTADAPTIFSPFGLGVLDIALARYVWEQAARDGKGTRLPFAVRSG